ncbi:MAG: fibronectin type III domain-containing protein, partial [Bacillota bacterium]|nr:fibronectin type III domain-containing protein [Bacillota bacterium]
MRKYLKCLVIFVVIMLLLSQNVFPPLMAAEDPLPDSQAPTKPENLVLVSKTDTSINISWDTSTDDTAVTEYDVFDNSSQISTSGTNSCTITGLNPSTTYNLTVKAKDAAGNLSDSSDLLSVTTDNASDTEAPSKPANLILISKTDTTISMSWDASTDNTAVSCYDIYNGADIIKQSVSGTSCILTGLNPCTGYSLSVKARDAASNSSTGSDILNVNTLPSIPSNVNAVPTTTSINLSWDAAPGATRYDVEVDGNIIDNSTNTTYTKTGLLSNTQHTFRVRTKYNGDTSDWSTQVVSTTNTLSIPANINITKSLTSITLNWNTVNEATEYEVEADGIVVSNLTGTSYTQNGLTPNSKHSYRVRAKNSGGTSEWSAIVTATADLTNIPSNVTTLSTNNKITISWSDVTAATGYDIEVDGIIVDNGTSTSFIHDSLSPNTQHKYRVRARYGTNLGDWSSLITTLTSSDIPNMTVTAFNNSIVLTWNSVNGAVSYDIEVDGNIILDIKGNSYVHSNLESNSNHTYRIRSKNSNGISEWSTLINQTTANIDYSQDMTDSLSTTAFTASSQASSTYSAARAFNNIWNENNSGWMTPAGTCTNSWVETDFGSAKSIVRLTYQADAWNNGDYRGGMKNFRVEYSDNNSSWNSAYTGIALQNGSRQEFVWSAVGSHRYWRVFVIDCYNASAIAISEIEMSGALTPGFTVPTGITIPNVTGTSITLNWTAVTGATSYDISIDGVVYSNITNTNTYTTNGLTPNTQHTFKIRAKNYSQISDWSTPVNQNTPLTAPINISKDIKSTSITLSWQAIPGATGYDVEVDGAIIDNGTSLTYTNSGLLPNTQHKYRVRTRTDSDLSGWSDLITITTASDIPINITATSLNSTTTLTWPAVDGATGYDIEADGIVVGSTNISSYTQYGLSQNSSHKYRVRSKNSTGVSDWSELITQSTTNIDYSQDLTDSLSTSVFTASSQASTTYSAARAFNNIWNENGTGWMTPTGTYTNSWLKVDFGTPQPIVRLMYQADSWSNGDYRGGMKNFRAEYSDDNTNWNSAYTGIAQQNGSKQEFVWPNAGSHRYWRIYVVDSYNTSAIAISEIELESSLTSGLTAPASVTTSNITGTSITVNWTAVTGATAYDIEVDGVVINNITTTTYPHSGLDTNSQHTYRVRAKNATQVSAWSTLVNQKTLAHKGTVDDPFTISTRIDMENIKNNLSACYALTSDVDLGGTEWLPLGSSSTPFTGTLDGKGFKISNVSINKSITNYIGLFGYTTNAVIKNLGINNVNITGGSYVGAIIGLMSGTGSIQNCYVTGTGTVKGTAYVGGMI